MLLGPLCHTTPSPLFSLNFQTSVLPDGVSVVRTAAATYINASGLQVSAPVNSPRLDYNPSTNAPRGLLVEPVISDYMPSSNNIAAWTLTNLLPTANGAYGPDGTMDATLLVPTTTNGNHRAFTNTTFYSKGGNVIYSALIKDLGYHYVTFGISSNGGLGSDYAIMIANLQTGVVSATPVKLNTFSINSYGAIPAGNGFWQVWVNVAIGANNIASGWIGVGSSATLDSFNSGFAGNGTSGIAFAGTQFEIAPTSASGPSAGPTTIIANSTTETQRQQDLAYFIVPNDVYYLKYTFDDGTTQGVYASPGLCCVPTIFPRSASGQIKRIARIEAASPPAVAPHVFLETDLSDDIDDILALCVCMEQHVAGNIFFIGANGNSSDPYSVPCMAAMLNHAGFGHITRAALGSYQGTDIENYVLSNCYTKLVMNRFGSAADNAAGTNPRANYPSGVTNLRRVLAAQPNNSVTIVSVGFFSNLAGLMGTSGDIYSPLSGAALFAAKACSVVLMAGTVGNANSDYNYGGGNGAGGTYAQTFLGGVPSSIPIHIVDCNFGSSIAFTPPSQFDVFANPFAYAYSIFNGSGARSAWDPMAAMYGTGAYSSLFQPNPNYSNGTISVINSNGGNTWVAGGSSGNATYLTVAGAVSVTSAVTIAATGNALTVAGATFTAGDVGKVIIINGAGAAGVALITTIATYVSSTQVTLATTATTPLTAASQNVTYYSSTAMVAALNAAAAAIS